MRRIPIRLKLVGTLAVPMACLLAVIVFEVVRTTGRVNEIIEETDAATAAVGPAGLMTALQDERTFAVVELIGQEESVTLGVTGYEETRRRTDEAIAEFKAEVEGKGGAVAEAYGPALEGLAALDQLRADIDADTRPHTLEANNLFADQVFERYVQLIAPFHEGNSHLALAIDDPTLRRGVELIDLASRQVETVALVIRSIVQGELNRSMDRSDIRLVSGYAGESERYAQQILEAPPPYDEIARDGVPQSFHDNLRAVVDQAIVGNVDLNAVIAAGNVPVEDSYNGLRDAFSEQLLKEAERMQDSAALKVNMFRVLALIALVAAAIATWLVSRSITGPLRSLTRQATYMANHRLPEAVGSILDTPLGDDVAVPAVDSVEVNTQDEVADVAHALNTVQDSALGLAVEQAVLRRNIADSFVNLGRRNQHLLSRQLNFITELEANETDPDTLANLFRLDHLATRMRRNAESLLLLAGVDPPRTWSGPVRVNDVIRAALGEVEDYQRVVDRGVEPAMVQGASAADLAHLLAELIDNALIYSPPDQAVEVRGGRRTEMDGGGYTLAVIDAGLGMAPDELERANRRLAGAESFTIAPSKYLGHYVAGHLAARHDIRVTLHTSQGGGVTAVVHLPPSLLVDHDHQLPPPPPPLPQMTPAPSY
ncbi:MAG TPA: nitrate- and nitrite sensing domain-containing protein [Acidimicrobiales bacterium]